MGKALHRVTGNDLVLIEALMHNGVSVPDIADRIGISTASIYKYIALLKGKDVLPMAISMKAYKEYCVLTGKEYVEPEPETVPMPDDHAKLQAPADLTSVLCEQNEILRALCKTLERLATAWELPNENERRS